MVRDIRVRHPNYQAFAPSWQIMRDAIGGEDDVKARGEDYLPMKSAQAAMTDPARKNASYASYRMRAEFPEIVAPTITGQVGIITAQPATIELPKPLEVILERATPDGKTLEGLISMVTEEILSTGRVGLMPSFSTRGPYIALYAAEAITNWDLSDDGSLGYVVLDESYLERNRETNVWGTTEQYREIELVGGRMESRTYTGAAGMGIGGHMLLPVDDQPARLRSTAGEAVDFMPFVIAGTRGLTINPDDVPLYGLARIAVRMYRIDADYMQSLHMTSEPTPWASGWPDVRTAVENGEVPRAIGANNLWILPQGGQAGFLEFSGPGLDAQRKAIDAAREAAATFGARMFDETNRQPESGHSRALRYGHTSASLRTISKSACAGVEQALRNLARWMGIDPKAVSVTPNTDWVTDTMTPAEIKELVAAWQAGAFSYETLFERLKAGKIIASDRKLEQEVKAIVDDELRGEVVAEDDPESGMMPLREEEQRPTVDDEDAET